jgi:hypothetical protein
MTARLAGWTMGTVVAVVGGVEVYAGPVELGAPDDLDAVIRDFLGDAKYSLAIAVQEVDCRSISDAILAARARGVRVQVILEGDYLMEAHPSADPWTAAGEFEENRVIHAAFLRAGIDVVTDLNQAIFHQKFVVRDAGESTAAVLCGSTNFTLTDTGHNTSAGPVVGNNLNHVVILHGHTVCDEYAAEFARLRSGTFGDLHERHEPIPAEFRLAGMRIKSLFAPQHGPELEIMKQMLKAADRVDFAMFTFAQSSGIDDTMIRVVHSGTAIRGLAPTFCMVAPAATPCTPRRGPTRCTGMQETTPSPITSTSRATCTAGPMTTPSTPRVTTAGLTRSRPTTSPVISGMTLRS